MKHLITVKHLIVGAGAVTLALTSLPARAHGTSEPEETVSRVFERELPTLPGKSLVAVEVLYPPGGGSPAHTHPKSAFIYAHVVSGEVVSAVGDDKPRVYRTGEGWYESPGAHHRVSRNASKTKPAKILAIFVLDAGERQLVFPDPK